MGVFPADHVVGKPAAYRGVLKAALKGGGGGNLMVVGIQPRWPETGYGYIEFPKGTAAGGREPVAVRRFHEKPELAKAKRYVAGGEFLLELRACSSGAPDVLLDAVAAASAEDRHDPGVAAGLRRAASSARS